MTFEDFMKKLREEPQNFEEYWRREHERVPDQFPMKMDEGQ